MGQEDADADGKGDVCDNCNNLTGEGVKTTYYRDADSDSYGNASVTIQACTAPAGYVTNSDDCDDTQVVYADNDNDTYGAGPMVPNCLGVWGFYVTNRDDCDDNVFGQGLIAFYVDNDGDGYGQSGGCAVPVYACTQPAGYSEVVGDCDDANAAVNPGAFEITGNGLDDDCNGLQDENAPGSCEYWKGKWAFTYKTKTDNITITDICSNPGAGQPGNVKPACMYNMFLTCQAKGRRASDNQTIMIGQLYMDQRIYAYYETWSPGSTTPYDAVHYRDFLDEAAYKANPFGYTGGYTEMIADIITDCDFVAAIDGTFKVYSQANPAGAPYASAFGLVSGERMGVVCATDNDTD